MDKMSEPLFEVTFSGMIMEGADPEDVKARVGKIFNADAAKIAQLFSGKRLTIKKNIDKATAAKYKTALNRAGAHCEVRLMGDGDSPASPPAQSAPQPSPEAATSSPVKPAVAPVDGAPVSMAYETQYDGEVAPPPQTDPLGITGDQIADLSASLAPVGSELQNTYADEPAPQIDISDLGVAPVGSDLGSAKREPDPPPPNTTGIELAD